ncbi:MAG: hypothetical protein HZC42_04540, partial [Candidatus Eisenbacteria bacterium]|nr:hypothetical protein [Candidatus Eisenbacteria bacterium]
MAPRPRRRAPRVAFPSVLHQPFLTLVLALAILGGPRPALATGDVTGQWSPNADSSRGQPGRYAIHLVLLRGDAQPYHSRILWWSGDRFGSFSGSEWGWRPASPGCDAFPDTSSLSAIYVPPSGINEFCAGHVPINGRLFVAGGTDSLTGA